MIIKIITSLSFILTSCSNFNNKLVNKSDLYSDTIIRSIIITNEIAGSSYREDAKEYFFVNSGDTSDFRCIFYKLNDKNEVFIDFNIPYLKNNIVYSERMKQFEKILVEAAKDYMIDSVKYISFGRLIQSGDLAISIANSYINSFGQKNYNLNGKDLNKFLLNTRISSDFNSIFKPYNLKVAKIDTDNSFFTTIEELYWASKIETDNADIPDKIFDSLIWIELANKR